MHVCVYDYICIRHVYIFVCGGGCVYACVCMYVCYLVVCICLRLDVYVCVFRYVFYVVCVRMYMRACVHVCVCILESVRVSYHYSPIS